MSFSSYNIEDADQQIITLEIEISQLQKNLVTMKRARNSFTPFCRLPNEILVRILRQMQVEPSLYDPDGYRVALYRFRFSRQWEKAIFSCAWIYYAATSTPELCTHISLLWPSHRIQTGGACSRPSTPIRRRRAETDFTTPHQNGFGWGPLYHHHGPDITGFQGPSLKRGGGRLVLFI
jgi:hypothetical protein